LLASVGWKQFGFLKFGSTVQKLLIVEKAISVITPINENCKKYKIGSLRLFKHLIVFEPLVKFSKNIWILHKFKVTIIN